MEIYGVNSNISIIHFEEQMLEKIGHLKCLDNN